MLRTVYSTKCHHMLYDWAFKWDIMAFNAINHSYCDLSHKALHHVPDLDSNITFLNLRGNPLKTLTNLPKKLEILDVSDCMIQCITPNMLPHGLHTLIIYGNKFTKIQNMCTTLRYLFIGNEYITKIENLHQGLLSLTYNSTCTQYINKIENIPSTLQILDLDYQNISKIEGLPHGLKCLSLRHNRITVLNNVPNTVQNLILEGNQIDEIRHIPKNCTRLVLSYWNTLNKDQLAFLRCVPGSCEAMIERLKRTGKHGMAYNLKDPKIIQYYMKEPRLYEHIPGDTFGHIFT